MKYRLTYLIIALLFVINSNCQTFKGRVVLGEKYAREFVKKAINDKTYKPFYDTLITDKQTAINIVEPVLFKVYGKPNIENQKPYECYLIDGYWYVAGTLSKDSKGGVFEVVVSAKDEKIIKLVHGK